MRRTSTTAATHMWAGMRQLSEQGRKSDNRMGEQPERMEESVSNVLDAIPPQARVLITEELERRNPDLLAELFHVETDQ